MSWVATLLLQYIVCKSIMCFTLLRKSPVAGEQRTDKSGALMKCCYRFHLVFSAKICSTLPDAYKWGEWEGGRREIEWRGSKQQSDGRQAYLRPLSHSLLAPTRMHVVVLTMVAALLIGWLDYVPDYVWRENCLMEHGAHFRVPAFRNGLQGYTTLPFSW